MLGLVYTELVEMVEERHSASMVDAILRDVAPQNGGAYTAVGYYPADELLALVAALSVRSGESTECLLEHFGEHLLGRFAQGHPAMFAGCPHLFDFLASVDGHIHVQVRKLYPQAELPRLIVVSRDARRMVIRYISPRPMLPLAQGLIRGAATYFKQACTLRSEPDAAASASLLVVELTAA